MSVSLEQELIDGSPRLGDEGGLSRGRRHLVSEELADEVSLVTVADSWRGHFLNYCDISQ